MQEIRLKFSKTGRAKYISHLDLNRAFSRAFSRAGIPLHFTEGFNPHPFMSFSLPLSLGVESYCENVDIRIPDDYPMDSVKDKMNAALPDGIRIVDVYGDFMQPSDIMYSDYVFQFEFEDNEAAYKKLTDILEGEEIPALKKAKQGKRRIMKETNIKTFIVSYSLSVRGDRIILNTRLLAGPEKNLNPSLLFDTLIRLMDMNYLYKEIGRIRLLTADLADYK